MKRQAAAVLMAIVTCFQVSASTMLVYTQSDLDGVPEQPPTAVREGVLDALFEGGTIVFDVGNLHIADVDWETGSSDALLAVAIEGGADYVLLVRDQTRAVGRDPGRFRYAASAQFWIVDVASFQTIHAGVLEATNEGREETTNRWALGIELGEAVALRAASLLRSAAAP